MLRVVGLGTVLVLLAGFLWTLSTEAAVVAEGAPAKACCSVQAAVTATEGGEQADKKACAEACKKKGACAAQEGAACTAGKKACSAEAAAKKPARACGEACAKPCCATVVEPEKKPAEG